jgi:phosphatidylglycerol lysyltransferase
MWARDIYPRRNDAPRGVMPHVMLYVARQMQQEGVERLSLSLCPALRCDEPVEGDSAMVRRGTAIWWRWCNWIFDFRGIYHYKSRFRPNFETRYYAASPRLTVLSIRSTMLMWGILEPTPYGMVRHLWRKWRQRTNRRLLADPTAQPASREQAPVETITNC